VGLELRLLEELVGGRGMVRAPVVVLLLEAL
jgi:hypothetical protein